MEARLQPDMLALLAFGAGVAGFVDTLAGGEDGTGLAHRKRVVKCRKAKPATHIGPAFRRQAPDFPALNLRPFGRLPRGAM